MIRNLQTPLLFIRAPHSYTFSSPPPFSRQTKAVPGNKAGYSQVHSARYGQVQNVILTDHKKCYFLHLWCFYFSLQNMFKNLLVVSWLVCWQITIQSLRSKCWQFYETISCENMFWIEALCTWMRVIQRKCNASKNCVWYLYLATTLKFKSRSRNMWFFFVFWEMRVQEADNQIVGEDEFTKKSSPANLSILHLSGKIWDAELMCIPFWGDPNFLLCKTCRIASSFLQNFTRPSCTCHTTCDNNRRQSSKLSETTTD